MGRRKPCKIIEMFAPRMYLLLIFILKSRNSVFLTYICLNLLTGNSKTTSDNLNCCPSPVETSPANIVERSGWGAAGSDKEEAKELHTHQR